MDKLKLAHDYLLKIIPESPLVDGGDIEFAVATAWKYADAMQAEADKRKPSGFPEALREEWQPDWSVAPDWAKWWVATANKSGKITGGWFYEIKPEFGLGDGPSVYQNVGCLVVLTDSFGYQGDWKESLRERPHDL